MSEDVGVHMKGDGKPVETNEAAPEWEVTLKDGAGEEAGSHGASTQSASASMYPHLHSSEDATTASPSSSAAAAPIAEAQPSSTAAAGPPPPAGPNVIQVMGAGFQSFFRWWRGEKEDDGIARVKLSVVKHWQVTEPGRKKPYIQYELTAVFAGKLLSSEKLRFSTLRERNNALKAALPAVKLPSFPGRSIVTDMTDPGNAAERVKSVNRYLEQLLEIPEVAESSVFLDSFHASPAMRDHCVEMAAALREKNRRLEEQRRLALQARTPPQKPSSSLPEEYIQQQSPPPSQPQQQPHQQFEQHQQQPQQYSPPTSSMAPTTVE